MTIIYLDGTPEELAEFHRLVKEDDNSPKETPEEITEENQRFKILDSRTEYIYLD